MTVKSVLKKEDIRFSISGEIEGRVTTCGSRLGGCALQPQSDPYAWGCERQWKEPSSILCWNTIAV